MAAKDILVLEDDEAVAHLIKFFLGEEGYTVRITTDVKSFWERLDEHRPDLISLDILLPDGDGFKIFETLSRKRETKGIPVVFVTVKEGDKEKGVRMGARGYVIKPFGEDDLKHTIAQILES